jgi:hypothetical protein
MHQSLHLITTPPPDWVRQLIQQQRTTAETEVVELDLTSDSVDYREVLECIFSSDSISVW